MDNRICVITPYFGSFPHYFSVWLESCRRNETIDFFLFTDAEYNGFIPENVRIVPMTLSTMKRIAEEKLGMSISLERPYKCCDFKPVYGLIFQDYISSYSYWGHCDLDLVFGDLQGFLNRLCYQKYDKFLPLGHLCFYRNTEAVNHYYQLPGSMNGDYTEVFTSDRIFAYDELGGIMQIYKANHLPMFSERVFADISHMYHRFRLSEYCNLEGKDKNYPYQVFFWEDGHTYRSVLHDGKVEREEYMYIHFKKRPNYNVGFDVSRTNAFYITSTGFIEKTETELTKADFQRINPFRGELYEMIEGMWAQGTRYKGKLIKKIERMHYGDR